MVVDAVLADVTASSALRLACALSFPQSRILFSLGMTGMATLYAGAFMGGKALQADFAEPMSLALLGSE